MNIFSMWMLVGCGEKSSDTAVNLVADTAQVENDSSGVDTAEEQTHNPDTALDTGEGADADGDGFVESVDCNDTDSNTHPGAVDFPNDNQDQDCDGVDTALTPAGRSLSNPSFDNESDGVPTDWSDLGDGLAWQQNGAEIFTVNGGTGQTFNTHSGAGALKLWGDYGGNPYANGESIVYQQFLKTDAWDPAGQLFWMDAWVMIHDTDPLQNEATHHIGIRCFQEAMGTWTLLAEQVGPTFDSNSPTNSWMHVYASIECPLNTTVVQSIILFKQTNGADSSDHGAVFVDDVQFGTL